MALADNTAALQRILEQINALFGEEAAQSSAAEETGGEQTEKTTEK